MSITLYWDFTNVNKLKYKSLKIPNGSNLSSESLLSFRSCCEPLRGLFDCPLWLLLTLISLCRLVVDLALLWGLCGMFLYCSRLWYGESRRSRSTGLLDISLTRRLAFVVFEVSLPGRLVVCDTLLTRLRSLLFYQEVRLFHEFEPFNRHAV
jgi:hypothetical protein